MTPLNSIVPEEIQKTSPFDREEFGKDLKGFGDTRIHRVSVEDAIASRISKVASQCCITGSLLQAPGRKRDASGQQTPALFASGPAYTRDHPYLSSLTERRALTHPSSSKSTLHLDFAIDSALQYEAGDACGVVPQNCPELVDTVLSLLHFYADEPVQIPKLGSVPLREGLLRHFSIARLTRATVLRYASLAQCSQLTALLAPGQQVELQQYLHGRDFVDLLQEYPGVLQTPHDLVKMLPRLLPRLYSISSSPAAHSGRIHITVSVVRYSFQNRDRGGVCSTQLSDRTEVGERVPIYIQSNKKFRLPQSSTAPLIMIGPGTGIAPFRAFLHERRVTGATGRNWLFFGDRSAATDFLYRDELEEMLADGHLTHLSTAFSRDQEKKVYVQDLMRQNAKQFWGWLEEGASVYVCGDATHMAKDVDQMLRSVVKSQGSMSAEAADDYVHALKAQHRYHRDVY